MFTIENDFLRVSVKSKGAELSSLFSKESQLEFMWNGDERFWSKQSPILFPIVGTLKQNTYYYKGQPYNLGRHGFARDREFTCESQDTSSLVMTLTSDEKTLRVYPFEFKLNIIYRLDGNMLHVTYRVTNSSEKNEMYFSIGGHPAFRVPFHAGLRYHHYILEFEKVEMAWRWPISPEGLIEASPRSFLMNENLVPLRKELFRNDAIVLKHPNSDKITLRTKKRSERLEFYFPRFPYLGIWAAPRADFVCLEPWCGIADSITSNQQLDRKEGINFLAPGLTFERTWSVKLISHPDADASR